MRCSPTRSRPLPASQSSMSCLRSAGGLAPFTSAWAEFPTRSDSRAAGNVVSPSLVAGRTGCRDHASLPGRSRPRRASDEPRRGASPLTRGGRSQLREGASEARPGNALSSIFQHTSPKSLKSSSRQSSQESGPPSLNKRSATTGERLPSHGMTGYTEFGCPRVHPASGW